MSTTQLLAPVPSEQVLPGFLGKYSGNSSTGATWVSSSNAGCPDIGGKPFIGILRIRYGGAPTTGIIFSFYQNSTNYFQVRRFSDSKYYMQFVVGGSALVNIGATESVWDCETVLCFFRSGTTWGIACSAGGATNTLTLNADTPATYDDSANALGTLIANSSTRMGIACQNGVTSTRWDGALAGPFIWYGTSGQTLSDYGISVSDFTLNGDIGRLMQDNQRPFSAHGFPASRCVAFGNWQDSSGNAKVAIKPTQLAASDKLVCPFSGKAVVLASGSAQAANLAYPPYTLAAATPSETARGSLNFLDYPRFAECLNGVTVKTRVQIDGSTNPCFSLGFFDPTTGLPNRWPVKVPYKWSYTDSSAGNAVVEQFNVAPTGITAAGDTHASCGVIPVPDGSGGIAELLLAPYMHSSVYSNKPDTGDVTSAFEQYVRLSDAGVTHAFATSPQPNTYAHLDNRSDGTTINHTRRGVAESSILVVTEYNHATHAITRYETINGFADVRNYPGEIVTMSDGRSVATAYAATLQSGQLGGGTPAYYAYIVPPHADLGDNSKWFTANGHNLSGSDGVNARGSLNLVADHLALRLTNDNDSFFANLPIPDYDDSPNMHHVRMHKLIHVTGGWEGLAAIVQRSSGNANLNTLVTASSGGGSVIHDQTTIRRWQYYGGTTPRLELKDSFDIKQIMRDLNPGFWPQDSGGTTYSGDVVIPQCVQIGKNQMLLIVVDPETVAIGSSVHLYGSVLGFTLKGAIFYDMAGSDPTKYVDLLGPIAQINTNNSQGYGIYPYPGSAFSGYVTRTAYSIAGGEWLAAGYGNEVSLVTPLASLLPTIPAVGGLSRRLVQQNLIPPASNQ